MAARAFTRICVGFGNKVKYPCNLSKFPQLKLCCVTHTEIQSTVQVQYARFSKDISEKKDDQHKDSPAALKKKKQHQEASPKVTLVGTDDGITVVSLEDAEKLSKRRDLKLVKLKDFDTKYQRPLYKLMTNAQYLEEERKQRELKKAKKETGFKGEKLLTVSSKIEDHDLMSRLKNISKWLEKNYEIRVVVSGDASDNSRSDKIYDIISAHVKNEGRVVQKRQKGRDLKFQILPPKKIDKPEEEIQEITEK